MIYLNMDDSRMVSIPQVEAFIKVGTHIDFHGAGAKDTYQWVEEVLLRFRYFSCRKKEKSVIREYIRTATGYSRSRVTRLVGKKKRFGKVCMSSTRRHTFTKRYTSDDIARIIETDQAHDRLSGKATVEIFKREYAIFGNKAFERLKDISVSHLYNLRGTRQYAILYFGS